jgi:hypothetical protein
MLDTIKTGTILIQEGTLLPTGVPVESDVFLPGWRAVRNLDGYGLGRKIDEADWNFFYLAGEIRATVLGREGVETLRRAVKQILAKRTGQKFNSLEIAKVVSKRFLGVPYLNVSAHFRHIQQEIGLVPTKDFVLRMPLPSTAAAACPGSEELASAAAAANRYVAMTSNV